MTSLNSHLANLFHLGNFYIRFGLSKSSLLVGEGLLNPSFATSKEAQYCERQNEQHFSVQDFRHRSNLTDLVWAVVP